MASGSSAGLVIQRSQVRTPAGETSERRDGVHMGFSEHIDTILY